jgi:hypothetical protein
VKVVDDLRARGLALLTSSGADELSKEAKALRGSVFTHAGGEVRRCGCWRPASQARRWRSSRPC